MSYRQVLEHDAFWRRLFPWDGRISGVAEAFGDELQTHGCWASFGNRQFAADWQHEQIDGEIGCEQDGSLRASVVLDFDHRNGGLPFISVDKYHRANRRWNGESFPLKSGHVLKYSTIVNLIENLRGLPRA